MRPLIIFDIETSGLNKYEDHIVQFSAIKVDRETNKILDRINEYIRPEGTYTMSIGAYILHRIHPDFLKDKPTFKELSQKILDFLHGCDILTYNGTGFDIPFLINEFKRAGIEWSPMDVDCYDAYREEVRRNSHKLGDLFKRYCGRTMEEAGLQAHDGMADVKATYAIFRHQLEEGEMKPEELLTEDDTITTVNYEGQDAYALTYGKYKNVPIRLVSMVDMPYIKWVLTSDISNKAKEIINKEISKEG